MNTCVSVVGLGKLGSGFAAVIADAGIPTIGIDIDEKTIEGINAGTTPDVEPELRELIAKHGGKNLIASARHADAIEKSDITFLLVATPSDGHGLFSNRHLEAALESLATALHDSVKPYHLFVISSTVTPGAIEGQLVPLLEQRSGRKLNHGFGICYDPEFVALGAVVKGFQKPDAIVIGESDSTAGDRVEAIHRRICKNNPAVRRMSIVNAEISKVSLNVYLTMKITFGNMLANLCERIEGADCDVVSDAIGQDRRIGPQYLRGGLSYGGPCFPRDTKALAAYARERKLDPVLIDAIERLNEEQDEHLLAMTVAASDSHGGGPIGVLGLSFKPGTSVTMDSASVKLIGKLLDLGRPVTAYDPHAMDAVRGTFGDRIRYAASAEECIDAARVVIVANAEPEYRDAMHAYRGTQHKTVVDCWRYLDGAKLAANVHHVAMGRGVAMEPARISPNDPPPNAADKVRPFQRANILGVGIAAINMEQAVNIIDGWVQRREKGTTFADPAHCIVDCLRDENLRRVHNRASMVTPDGMSIAWILKLMGYKNTERVSGPDMMLRVCEFGVARGYRHFLYGGWPSNVVELLAQRLTEKFPGIQIVGKYTPPFRPFVAGEDKMIVDMINAANADIVWVGLGARKEDFFADAYIGKINAPVMCCVGAAFDFHAGVKPRAPMWMRSIGLEWFYRMLTEPRRLAPRYFSQNPVFIWNILLQALGKRPPALDA